MKIITIFIPYLKNANGLIGLIHQIIELFDFLNSEKRAKCMNEHTLDIIQLLHDACYDLRSSFAYPRTKIVALNL